MIIYQIFLLCISRNMLLVRYSNSIISSNSENLIIDMSVSRIVRLLEISSLCLDATRRISLILERLMRG